MYVPLALLAAMAFAVASIHKQRSAQQLPLPAGDRPRLARLMVQTVRHPSWLAGIAIDVVGTGLQVAALSLGPLDVVQPLTAVEVVAALLLTRTHRSRSSLVWASLLVCCLALISFVAVGGRHSSVLAFNRPVGLAGLAAVSCLLGACLWIGHHRIGRWAAVACGAGAGLSYAACAALISMVTAQYTTIGWTGVVLGWQLYLLAACAAVGLTLGQLGFRAGPLAQSLPAAGAVDLVASVVIGIVVFNESLAHGAAGRAGFGLAVAFAAVAVSYVSLRTGPADDERIASERVAAVVRSADRFEHGAGVAHRPLG